MYSLETKAVNVFCELMKRPGSVRFTRSEWVSALCLGFKTFFTACSFRYAWPQSCILEKKTNMPLMVAWESILKWKSVFQTLILSFLLKLWFILLVTDQIPCMLMKLKYLHPRIIETIMLVWTGRGFFFFVCLFYGLACWGWSIKTQTKIQILS